MLDDPLSLTRTLGINGATYYGGATYYDAVCTGRGPNSSTYHLDLTSSHYLDVFVGHQSGKRNRYTFRITETELVADPIDSTKNSQVSESVYVVVDRPVTGPTTLESELLNIVGGMLAKLTDSDSRMIRILGGET